MSKVKFATVWLDGCSGCHMSFLDMDERLLALAPVIDLVYSPLVDFKDFPPDVDLTLVEGAVSSVEDEHKIKYIRGRTKLLVSLGDCAITGNVPSMRNAFGPDAILETAYLADGLHNPQIPTLVVPPLLKLVQPVHTVVKVDVFIPGCPPPADVIYDAVVGLVTGETPELHGATRFGM